MTPGEAARAVAEDYDLIGTQDTLWMARAWYRYAHYLSTPTLQSEEPFLCGCGCGRTIERGVLQP